MRLFLAADVGEQRFALREKFLLGRARVHEYNVGVATPRKVERLSSSHGYDVHLDPCLLLESRKKMAEQPRLLGRRRRSDGYEPLLRLTADRSEGDQSDETDRKAATIDYRGNSPSRNWAASRDAGSLKNRSAGVRSERRP